MAKTKIDIEIEKLQKRLESMRAKQAAQKRFAPTYRCHICRKELHDDDRIVYAGELKWHKHCFELAAFEDHINEKYKGKNIKQCPKCGHFGSFQLGNDGETLECAECGFEP